MGSAPSNSPMRHVLLTITSLLIGIAVLLLGHSLTMTLTTLRAAEEQYPSIQIGLIMTAYFVGYIFGTLYCPSLINRIGHIRVFAAAAAICASLIIVQGLWIDPWFWLVARIIYGACMVALYLVVESWLNARANDVQRGRVFAIYMLVNLLAMSFGQQLLLLADIQQLELFAIGAALFSLSLVPIALTRTEEPEPIEVPVVNLRSLYRVSPVGAMSCLISGLVGGTFWTMAPLFGHQIGLDAAAVAALMSATILGGAVFQWPIGIYSDRHDRRKLLSIICFSAAITALISAFSAHMPTALGMAIMFIYGGLYLSAYPLSVAHTNDRASAADFVTLSGALLLVYGIGASVGPLIAGTLMQIFGPYSLPIFYAVSWFCLGIFIMSERKRVKPVPLEQQSHFVVLSRTSTIALQAHGSDIHEHNDGGQGTGRTDEESAPMAEPKVQSDNTLGNK